ncbi:hypothetical protein [Haliangium sp.]|uniref:hypothetical protein n=1 Tax=Haliangium sp. TaxID=2663208 RepID=UPI003D140E0F
MFGSRTTPGFGRHAGARFRCRVCGRFVTATAAGVCPHCAVPPPMVDPVIKLRHAGQRPRQARRLHHLRRRAFANWPLWLLALLGAVSILLAVC